MATLKQGILGGFSGKIGNIIGSSWKGIAVMRSMPLSVANPQTSAQVAQRTKLSFLVSIAKEINSDIIKPLLDRAAVQMSGYNLFIQQNMPNVQETYISSPADFIISSGKMESTPITTVSVNVSGYLVATWDDDSGEGYKSSSDLAYAVAVQQNSANVLWVGEGAIRSAGSITINSALADMSKDYDVYLAFRRVDGTVIGKTSYLKGDF